MPSEALKRTQNERKFGQWTELAGGGRRYWYEVPGKRGWLARYVKEVDSNEITIAFWQEIYDGSGVLVERHDKYPLDTGHYAPGSLEQ